MKHSIDTQNWTKGGTPQQVFSLRSASSAPRTEEQDQLASRRVYDSALGACSHLG
jgi:hypothetical protein